MVGKKLIVSLCSSLITFSMKENQNLDFKKIWKDEYLKYVSGFANSEGGVLLIGVDDCGNVVGVDNAKNFWRICPTRSYLRPELSRK